MGFKCGHWWRKTKSLKLATKTQKQHILADSHPAFNDTKGSNLKRPVDQSQMAFFNEFLLTIFCRYFLSSRIVDTFFSLRKGSRPSLHPITMLHSHWPINCSLDPERHIRWQVNAKSLVLLISRCSGKAPSDGIPAVKLHAPYQD